MDKDAYQLPNKQYENPTINSILLKDNFSSVNKDTLQEKQEISINEKEKIHELIDPPSVSNKNDNFEIKNNVESNNEPYKEEQNDYEEVV